MTGLLVLALVVILYLSAKTHEAKHAKGKWRCVRFDDSDCVVSDEWADADTKGFRVHCVRDGTDNCNLRVTSPGGKVTTYRHRRGAQQ